KTEKEKFAGAVNTYTVEALMHDGKALQSGTTHYFGTGFAQAFNIQFQSKEGKLEYVHQTSWGISTRLLGAIIMVHGDDEGLVLPPRVAPIQVVIIPIQMAKPNVMETARKMEASLASTGLRVVLDDSDRTPGWKYSEYEMKGIPIRLEIGPRDAEQQHCVAVMRHNREKIIIPLDQLSNIIPTLLDRVHQEMYQKALQHMQLNTRTATNYEEFKQIMDQQSGYVRMMVCDDEACEDKIKQETTATARCIPFQQEQISEKCSVCGKPATKLVIFAKAY
ncbi:MAG: His/Gly/Thr/Pro-type tRNA ligase C-terminal domain-containing protein, partial [Bacilli bacterium]